jgi:hypothetical protein
VWLAPQEWDVVDSGITPIVRLFGLARLVAPAAVSLTDLAVGDQALGHMFADAVAAFHRPARFRPAALVSICRYPLRLVSCGPLRIDRSRSASVSMVAEGLWVHADHRAGHQVSSLPVRYLSQAGNAPSRWADR